MGTKRRVLGAAAGCAVLLATALGSPAAGAQGNDCGKFDGPCLPLGVAPGRPTDVFFKVEIAGVTQGSLVAHTDLGTRVPFLGDE